MAVAPAGDSKWTHQMETLPNAKDYRRKVKYNLLFRTFFWLVKKFLNNSTLIFSWVDPLFWLGCRRSLDFNDLYVHPPEADSSYLLSEFNK